MFKKFRKYLIVAAGLMAFAMAGCSSEGDDSTSTTNPNPNPFTPKGTVSGVLTDRETQNPIANADVYIMDKHATTNAQGLFTIKNVPASVAVGNEPGNTIGNESYNVVIDMRDVNKKLTNQALYPDFAYTCVEVKYDSLGDTGNDEGNPPTVNASNHDTPVDGFVANIMPSVGKLEGSIWVPGCQSSDWTPVVGAPARLYSTGSDNSATGDSLHIVQTVTTDSSGIAKFENVEVLQSFKVFASSADGTLNGGPKSVQSFGKGNTVEYLAQGIRSPLDIDSVDNIEPFITFTTPENLSDIGSGTTNVEYNFSEPIAPTPYALDITESMAQGKYALFNDVTVQFLGAKAPATIPFTLAWNATMTKLTVTFTTVPGSKYACLLNTGSASGRPWLQDAAGNILDPAGLTGKAYFTTSGGSAVTAAPVMIKSSGDILSWLPVANATKYRLYSRTTTNGVVGPYTIVTTQSNTSYSAAGLVYSTNEDRNVYDFYVVGISTNLVEGPSSNVINFADTTAGSITSFAGGLSMLLALATSLLVAQPV